MARPRFYTDEELSAWVPFAALLELLPRELDGQLLRDAQLTHFDYVALTMVNNAQDRLLRMSELAAMTGATLPRLSHVVSRLEERGFLRRERDPADARTTRVALTAAGRRKLLEATPAHVENVRRVVLDALTASQRRQLRAITEAILPGLDPEGRFARNRPR